ncbi:MAG: ABC transporter permease [Asgard group archaeon]|nr:ABC transporter permease [Asgard group archaeon]
MKDVKRFNPPKKEIALHKKFFNILSFNLNLIFKNIRNRKRSTVIIILGLTFSLSILYTASIWSLTSQKIIADDYVESLDYEMYIESWQDDIEIYNEMYDFTALDSLVEQVDWIFPAIALFNYEDKNDTYEWYPEDNQEDMDNPLSLSNGFVITNRAMNRISLNLEIEGNSSMQSGEILISYTQAKQLEEIYNEEITPGYKINLAISRRIPNTDRGETQFQDFEIEDTTFENYTVAGIYKFVGHNTIIDRLVGGGATESAGTIFDSIFFPADVLTPYDFYRMTNSGGIFPRLLVKTNAQQLREQGISNMPDNLLALRDRIQVSYYHAYCYVLDHALAEMTNEYARAFGSTNLFVPTIATAVFLTFFSTQITIKKRREEISFLRSKGAASSQIIGIFFGEFFIISFISLILGIGVGILLSALIPSFGQNQLFNRSLFIQYFQEIEISPYDIEILTILILGSYLGLTLLNVIIYVRKDIQETMLVTQKGQWILELSVKILAFVLTVAGFLFFLLLEYRKLAENSLNYGLSLISASYRALYLFIAVLFFSCYFLSLGVNFILRNMKTIYNRIFKKTGFFIQKNMLRIRKSFTELTFFTVLIVCLLTTIIIVRSTSIHNNNIEDDYRQGADLRIQSTIPVNITKFENQIQSIEGVQNALGFYSIKASVRLYDIEVFGIDPLKFLQIGRWIEPSLVGMSAETALTQLANNPLGVIMSKFLVERFRKNIGDPITIQDIRGGTYEPLILSAIINSAPGLGVSHGYDPKMNRQVTEWVLVNKEIIRGLGINNGTLFLAATEENADIEYISEEIKKINPFAVINPEKINPDYIGFFIREHIPPANNILLVGAIFVNIIGIVYIFISTDFILEQRRKENAVLLALGGKQSKVRKSIVNEILSFITTSFAIGIPVGFLASMVTLTFIKPLLITREVVPMTIHINALILIVMIISLFAASLIGIIPIIRKQMKYEIVHELRAIV